MSNKKNSKKKPEQKAQKKQTNLVVIIAAVVAAIAVVVGIWFIMSPKTPVEKGITVTILNKEDKIWATTFATRKSNLGDALEEKGIIEADGHVDGVVHTVRGEKTEDNAVWKLYVNAVETPGSFYEISLETGKEYRLEYTIKD